MTSPDYDPEDLAISYHEVGHAAVAAYLNYGVEYVALARGGGGACQVAPADLERRAAADPSGHAADSVAFFVAGVVAQQVAGLGHIRPDGARADLRSAHRMSRLAGGARADVVVAIAYVRAEYILRRVWPAVEELAGRLIARRRLPGHEVALVVERAISPNVPERPLARLRSAGHPSRHPPRPVRRLPGGRQG